MDQPESCWAFFLGGLGVGFGLGFGLGFCVGLRFFPGLPTGIKTSKKHESEQPQLSPFPTFDISITGRYSAEIGPSRKAAPMDGDEGVISMSLTFRNQVKMQTRYYQNAQWKAIPIAGSLRVYFTAPPAPGSSIHMLPVCASSSSMILSRATAMVLFMRSAAPWK